MKIIAHRGNLYGPDPETENTPNQIKEALSIGFYIEVDVWYYRDVGLMSGHDKGAYPFNEILAKNLPGLFWVHCKNVEAEISFEINMPKIKTFIHSNEPFVKVSDGSIWLYPGTPITDEMLSAPAIVACLPELAPEWDISRATHICTDYPILYKEKYM